jgi:hypothetical protein
MERVKHYLFRNYHLDPKLFFLEMVSVMLQISAAAYLSITAKDPDMLTVYSLYTVGSSIGIFVYYKRQLVWTLIMVSIFTGLNILGLVVLLT